MFFLSFFFCEVTCTFHLFGFKRVSYASLCHLLVCLKSQGEKKCHMAQKIKLEVQEWMRGDSGKNILSIFLFLNFPCGKTGAPSSGFFFNFFLPFLCKSACREFRKGEGKSWCNQALGDKVSFFFLFQITLLFFLSRESVVANCRSFRQNGYFSSATKEKSHPAEEQRFSLSLLAWMIFFFSF